MRLTANYTQSRVIGVFGAPVLAGAPSPLPGRPAEMRPAPFRVYSGTSDKQLHPAATGCLWAIKEQNGPGPH
jgi:hypothetical protein